MEEKRKEHSERLKREAHREVSRTGERRKPDEDVSKYPNNLIKTWRKRNAKARVRVKRNSLVITEWKKNVEMFFDTPTQPNNS